MKSKTKLSKLKKGELFVFIGKNKIYIYNGKSRGKFTYSAYNDISAFYETKTDRDVDTNF